MIVISDTSAITSLIQVGRADILAKLFAQVIIPPAVRKAGEIDALSSMLDNLEKSAGFRISTELRAQALAAVGEQ